MALSEAQRKAHDKYFKENYRQVKLSMPKNEADTLEFFCNTFGYSKAGFIRLAIAEKMDREKELDAYIRKTARETKKTIKYVRECLRRGDEYIEEQRLL